MLVYTGYSCNGAKSSYRGYMGFKIVFSYTGYILVTLVTRGYLGFNKILGYTAYSGDGDNSGCRVIDLFS